MTSRQIEKQIELYPTWYLDYKFPPTEFGKGVSKGIKGYFELREQYPYMIPTEKDYVDRFLSKTLPLFQLDKLGIDYQRYKLGLMARAKRSYRSLVREEHAEVRMRELYEPHGFSIKYDEEDDWRKGIDVTIQDLIENKEFYVHLFVDSPWSRRHRKKKENRGSGRDFTDHLDLPYKREEGKKVGDFGLYTDKMLMDFMKKLRTDYKHKGKEIGDD